MKRRSVRIIVAILAGIAVIMTAGCPNNLVSDIKKEVEIVVTPPSVVSFYPGAESGVSTDSQISITFTKRIDSSTVTSASFIVKDSFGQITTGQYNVSNDTITFTPNNLYYDTNYTVTVTDGILDVDGNPMSKTYSWKFATEKAPSDIKPVINDLQINNGKSITRESSIDLGIDAEDHNGERTGLQFRYHLKTDASWSGWIDLTDGIASVTVEISPSGNGNLEEAFTFEAEVRDRNMVVSESAETQIVYKTTPPAIDSRNSNPSPDSVVPSNQSYVDVVFDAEMDPGTITSDTIYVSKGVNRISTVEYTLINDRKGVRFSKFELGGSQYFFEQNTDYTVFVSGSVSDIAGNQIGSDYSYSFSTGTAVDTTAPEGKVVLNLDSSGFNATGSTSFDLMIKASDDYNGVRAVKIWGDNDGTLPVFENDAGWKLYSEGSTTAGGVSYMSYNAAFGSDWSLPGSDGDYYVYYKFVDFAGNETPRQERVRISLDTTNPVLNAVQIDSGSGYSNNTSDVVSVLLDAEDLQSGLEGMWISSEAGSTLNLPASGSGSWEDWESLTTDYSLDSGEGKYYIYAEVRDYVGRVSGVGYSSVILDYTNPVVTFSDSDKLEVNAASLQQVTITDDHPASSPASWQVPSGLASYSWEQISGPGTLRFYSDSSLSTEDSTVEHPYIGASADDGTEDGTYEIKVTVTDNAGNTGYGTVEYIWDTTDPGDVGTITAYNADGTVLTSSSSNSGPWVYTRSAQPYASWAETEGADFYMIIPADELFDPNDDSNTDGRYWDAPIDWDNPPDGYIRNDNPTVSPPAPDNPGDNDGPVYLYVAARDNAGNRSNGTSTSYVRFWIDTLAPVIVNLNNLAPSNEAFTINYHTSDDSGDGRVYDRRTTDDPSSGTDGSGIASYLWTQSSGSGTLTITNASTLSPTVSAAADGSADGQYELKLTVTDNAGNVTEGYVSFVWDTTAPSAPQVDGIDHTPSTIPVWSWTSSGGGSNQYRYKLDRIGRNWESGGGGYYGSAETVIDWTATTDISYSSSGLDDKYEYTMYVQERDEAGNWSDSGSKSIWIDTDYTSEPAITRDGLYLRNADDRSVTWNWTTGLGNPTTEKYRYRLVNSSSTDVIAWTDLADNVSTVTIDFAAEGLADDVYTLVVEEYNVDNGTLVGKEGYSNVKIDATAPNAPVMKLYPYSTGNATSGSDPSYYLTNDNTPRLWWDGDSSDGSGNYRWKFDGGSWTYTTSKYFYSDTKSDGAYIFYVQERDAAGNWSASAEYKLEIDTTAPSLTSILLRNRSANASNSTAYTVSPYVDIEVSGSGSNLKTYTSGDIRYMRFWNSGGNKLAYSYASSLSGWNFSNGGGNSSDGYKYVYCELIDYAGNVSVSRYDGIILDTVSPVVDSYSVNGGAAVTSSSSVTLDSTYSGANYMRISNDGGSTWSGWYTPSTSRSWTLSTSNGYNGYGAKKVTVQFTDYAGYYSRNTVTGQPAHYTQKSDSIFYGTPVIKHATKGYYSSGGITTYYENYPSDTGSANTYYVYYATSPTGTKSLKGSTTNSSYYYNSTYSKGTLYYLFVRVYNPDIGYTDYSSYTPGFSSNITVIYDDDDSTDTALANSIKSLLQSDLTVYSTISGTMPSWTVTLLPEDLVSTVYDGTANIIYGDPVIVTPSTAALYGYPGRVRNIVAGNHGVVGMSYYGGLKLFETVSDNWTSWGYSDPASSDSGQRPDQINYGEGSSTYTYVADRYYMYTWRYGNSVWTSPLSSTSIPTGSSEDLVQVGYSTSTLNERGLILSGNPDNGYIYGRSQNYTDRYPVVRQGRFLYYGYDGLWTRTYTGKVYFVNLIARMDNY